ncbi:MAG: hypothetical protein MUP15_01205 [Dehalococcoidia bacterium]|nr:hypothetical protein [Dehalococcoidia bacterium]
MNKREELAAAFLANLQTKRFDDAAAMLNESVTLTVPQVPNPIQGRDAVIMAMRMAADSGQGLDMVGFATPAEQPDGAVRVAGKAPKGLLWIVAFVLRKAKKVTVTLRFGEGDLIEAMDLLLA